MTAKLAWYKCTHEQCGHEQERPDVMLLVRPQDCEICSSDLKKMTRTIPAPGAAMYRCNECGDVKEWVIGSIRRCPTCWRGDLVRLPGVVEERDAEDIHADYQARRAAQRPQTLRYDPFAMAHQLGLEAGRQHGRTAAVLPTVQTPSATPNRHLAELQRALSTGGPAPNGVDFVVDPSTLETECRRIPRAEGPLDVRRGPPDMSANGIRHLLLNAHPSIAEVEVMEPVVPPDGMVDVIVYMTSDILAEAVTISQQVQTLLAAQAPIGIEYCVSVKPVGEYLAEPRTRFEPRSFRTIYEGMVNRLNTAAGLNLSTATGEDLDRIGAMMGIERQPAAPEGVTLSDGRRFVPELELDLDAPEVLTTVGGRRWVPEQPTAVTEIQEVTDRVVAAVRANMEGAASLAGNLGEVRNQMQRVMRQLDRDRDIFGVGFARVGEDGNIERLDPTTVQLGPQELPVMPETTVPITIEQAAREARAEAEAVAGPRPDFLLRFVPGTIQPETLERFRTTWHEMLERNGWPTTPDGGPIDSVQSAIDDEVEAHLETPPLTPELLDEMAQGAAETAALCGFSSPIASGATPLIDMSGGPVTEQMLIDAAEIIRREPLTVDRHIVPQPVWRSTEFPEFQPGGHVFDADGRCACGQRPTDDPRRCPADGVLRYAERLRPLTEGERADIAMIGRWRGDGGPYRAAAPRQETLEEVQRDRNGWRDRFAEMTQIAEEASAERNEARRELRIARSLRGLLGIGAAYLAAVLLIWLLRGCF